MAPATVTPEVTLRRQTELAVGYCAATKYQATEQVTATVEENDRQSQKQEKAEHVEPQEATVVQAEGALAETMVMPAELASTEAEESSTSPEATEAEVVESVTEATRETDAEPLHPEAEPANETTTGENEAALQE